MAARGVPCMDYVDGMNEMDCPATRPMDSSNSSAQMDARCAASKLALGVKESRKNQNTPKASLGVAQTCVQILMEECNRSLANGILTWEQSFSSALITFKIWDSCHNSGA